MKKPLLGAIIFSLIYGLQIVLLQHFIRSNLHPIHITFITYTIGGVLLLAYFALFSRETFKFNSKKGIKLASSSSIFSAVLADLLVLYGIKSSSALNWGMLAGLTTITTFMFAMYYFGEKLTKNKVIAIFLSIIGVLFVIYKGGQDVLINFGDLLFFGAIVSYGFANVISQRALQFISLKQLALVRLVVPAVIVGIIALIGFPLNTIPDSAWGFLVYTGIFIITATSLMNYIIKEAGATYFSLTTNLIPVVVAVLVIFITKDMPTFMQLVGGGLIIGSVVLFQHKYSSTS